MEKRKGKGMARNWIKWFRFPSTFLFLLSNKLSESGPASGWIGWMLLLDTLFPNEVSECVDLHNNLIRLFPLSPLPSSPFLLFKNYSNWSKMQVSSTTPSHFLCLGTFLLVSFSIYFYLDSYFYFRLLL